MARQRRSAINTKRRIEFGKAVLLGFLFTQEWRGGRQWLWKFTVPDNVDKLRNCSAADLDATAEVDWNSRTGWVTGFYRYRHEAVTSALNQAGVLDGAG